ncbi:MAG: alpha-galactosidase [Bacteroidota bacterium]
MKKENLFFELGDMLVYFVNDKETGRVGFGLIPWDCKGLMAEGRKNFDGDPEIGQLPEEWRPTVPRDIFSLAQVRCAGDSAHEGGFGRSMLNGQTSDAFQLESQQVGKNGHAKTITTILKAPNGLQCTHRLIYSGIGKRITVHTSYKNCSNQEISLEMASSFSLSDLSPFDATCSHDRLYLHRFKAFWSREGKHVVDSINDLQMSPSWHVAHFANEKFGQVGSWPTHGWYPQMALEDREAGVMWGVRLAWSGSWQMELFRRDDQLNIAGGLADYDFGHWKKSLQPGEELTVPEVFLTTCRGNIDELSSRLLNDRYEKSDRTKIPITFNEWCTSWGEPSESSIEQIAKALKPLECDYLVIDAGWYQPDQGFWNNAQGDWNPSKKLYPHGLKRAAEIITENGLKPGLWFEYEVAGFESQLFQRRELFLHADGKPIQVGTRRFLDFRNKEVIEHLDEKVIKTLSEGGFEYIKIDYNSSIGKGADGTESLGESLRLHLLEAGNYLNRIRDEIPGIFIENCSSGGMRLDPFTLSLSDVGMFSDAHASPEIPLIAANMHRLVHPSKLVVWAVVRPEESLQRINYSMAALFLGNPGISGGLHLLDKEQFNVVKTHLAMFRRIDHLILNGSTRIFGDHIENYRTPKGCQVVLRENRTDGEALLVCHSFELGQHEKTVYEINLGEYLTLKESLNPHINLDISGKRATITFNKSWAGAVFHLSKPDKSRKTD